DTVHPSTLDLLDELGLLEKFLALPHQRFETFHAQIGDEDFTLGDFTHLPTRCRFVAMIPQWDFLDLLAEAATQLPSFRLQMNAEVTGLIEEDGCVAGVHVATPDRPFDVRALLTIGADGRHSIVRRAAGLPIEETSQPIDVLWLRLSRRPSDPPETLARF